MLLTSSPNVPGARPALEPFEVTSEAPMLLDRSFLRAEIMAHLLRSGARKIDHDWESVCDRVEREVATGAYTCSRRRQRRVLLERQGSLRYTADRVFWETVLELLLAGNLPAFELLWTTLLQLLHSWDRRRLLEDDWEDIAQQVSLELAARFGSGSIRHPRSLLYRLARCRFLDACRKRRDSLDLDDSTSAGIAPDTSFVGEALSRLGAKERTCIVLMDLHGLTRVEVAERLGLRPGEIGAIRRRGLRNLWRWLGDALPAKSKRLWNEMFKGGERISPETASKRLGITPKQARREYARALSLLGL